jgi:hypothetical protein
MQSSSHSCPIDSKDELVIPSKTCARDAVGEMEGCNFAMPECVALMMWSLGRRTDGPEEVGL